MSISKKLRQKVFEKYGGRCAYSGKPLDDKWQVDHVRSVYNHRNAGQQDEAHSIENLLPALRILNHYKREKDLEMWRSFLLRMHLRLKKLPKTTSLQRTEKRIKYLREVADHFGITEDKPFSGVFYFESLNSNQ